MAEAGRARDGRLRRLHRDLGNVAPDPVLALLEGLDERVLLRGRVLGGVLVGRRVAAADAAAGQAQPQMDPATARLQTLLAPLRRVRVERLDHVQVRAGVGHAPTLPEASRPTARRLADDQLEARPGL